jgi:hypothetical protein
MLSGSDLFTMWITPICPVYPHYIPCQTIRFLVAVLVIRLTIMLLQSCVQVEHIDTMSQCLYLSCHIITSHTSSQEERWVQHNNVLHYLYIIYKLNILYIWIYIKTFLGNLSLYIYMYISKKWIQYDHWNGAQNIVFVDNKSMSIRPNLCCQALET